MPILMYSHKMEKIADKHFGDISYFGEFFLELLKLWPRLKGILNVIFAALHIKVSFLFGKGTWEVHIFDVFPSICFLLKS